MTSIRELDSLTVSKIAAGEVIERPASIVKELVENSIDANASNIIVETKDGGTSLIRITDNGSGMNREDLEIAFKRHTTSKLTTVEDLNRVLTMGFRGEALSSIAAVSLIEIITKTENMSAGIRAELLNGEITDISPAASKTGTTIFVRNIFSNVPVRKRFLKSNRAEDGYINDVLTRLAIGNPSIAFKYIRDNRIIFNTNGKGDVIDTAFELLGGDNAKGLISLDMHLNNIKITGFISNNQLYRSNRKHQYLFVNGRSVSDYRLSRIVENKYSSLIPINKYPIFILFIEIDPKYVDINIHPTKQEIKFSDDSNFYSELGILFKADRVNVSKVPSVSLLEKEHVNEVFPSIWDLKVNDKPSSKSIVEFEDLTLEYKDPIVKEESEEKKYFEEVEDTSLTTNKQEKNIRYSEFRIIGSVLNTYILAENPYNNSLAIIDQHAAHERIMYEKLINEYSNESIPIQQLLTPVLIELSTQEYENSLELLDNINAIGFELEDFGDNTLALRGIPLVFGKPSGKDMLLDIIDNATNAENLHLMNREKLMKLSCTAAIKAGDRLNIEEVKGLFQQLDRCKNSLTCPHGRPIAIEITKKELEKKFLRIL